MPGLSSDRTIPGRLFRTVLIPALIVAASVGFVFAAGYAGVRFNRTPSVPIGLYRLSQESSARYIGFCLPEPFGSMSLARGYRARSPDGCPDGGVPLLKTVVARAGDRVETSVRGLTVNTVPLPNTAPRSVDSVGRVLTAWPAGVYEVEPGTVWVASSTNPRSFDSRYFGPIPDATIRYGLEPVWTE